MYRIVISRDRIVREEICMSDGKIKVNNNGPLLVTGDVEMVDADGNVFETKKAFPCVAAGSHPTSHFAMERIRRLALKVSQVRNKRIEAPSCR